MCAKNKYISVLYFIFIALCIFTCINEMPIYNFEFNYSVYLAITSFIDVVYYLWKAGAKPRLPLKFWDPGGEFWVTMKMRPRVNTIFNQSQELSQIETTNILLILNLSQHFRADKSLKEISINGDCIIISERYANLKALSCSWKLCGISRSSIIHIHTHNRLRLNVPNYDKHIQSDTSMRSVQGVGSVLKPLKVPGSAQDCRLPQREISNLFRDHSSEVIIWIVNIFSLELLWVKWLIIIVSFYRTEMKWFEFFLVNNRFRTSLFQFYSFNLLLWSFSLLCLVSTMRLWFRLCHSHSLLIIEYL